MSKYMEHIQFRIHLEYKDVSGFVVSMLEKCSKGFVFQHPEDEKVNRSHIHGFMFDPTITRKTCSEQIAKKLNLKGNKDFFTSSKCGEPLREMDLSGAYCYGSKWNSIAPNYIKNISPDLLDELKNYSQNMGTTNNIHRSITTVNTVYLKEIKVKTKPTQYQHVMTLVNRINQIHPELFTLPFVEQRHIIFESAFSYFRDNELFMGKYKQLDFLDMVLLKLNFNDYTKTLYADFTKRTSQYIV